jgi:hypothetical protein
MVDGSIWAIPEIIHVKDCRSGQQIVNQVAGRGKVKRKKVKELTWLASREIVVGPWCS